MDHCAFQSRRRHQEGSRCDCCGFQRACYGNGSDQANRRALTLWALELAKETVLQLTEKYPEDRCPQEAIAAARAWVVGEIKIPIAKRANLNCHAMAKKLTDPADIAQCHAVGQTCSVATQSAMPWDTPCMISAIVLEHGLDNCRDAVEQRVMYYEQRLRYWMEYEKTCQLNWAGFLKNHNH